MSADKKSSSGMSLAMLWFDALFRDTVFNLNATSSGDNTLKSLEVFTTKVSELFAYSRSLSSERLARLLCR